MYNKSDILSDQELIYLKKELRLSYFTWILGFLILTLIIQALIYSRSDSFEILKLEISVISGTVILTYFFANYFTRELRTEIKDGRKIILYKLIEEKQDFMDRQDRFSPEVRKYVILAGGKKYLVTEEQYKKAEVSDYLVVHLTPKRELTIKTEILKK
jgi:hypothetical protein